MFPLDHISLGEFVVISVSVTLIKCDIFFLPQLSWSQDAEDECGSQLFAEEQIETL